MVSQTLRHQINLFTKVMLFGGLSLLFILYWEVFRPTSAKNLSLMNQYIFMTGTILALIIYQPHFVSTYIINYSRDFEFLKKHKFVFIIFPILGILFLALSLLQIFFLGQMPYEPFYKFLLVITMLGVCYHFSAQSTAAAFYLLGRRSVLEFKITKYFLILISLFGFYQNVHFRRGMYSLFNLSFEVPLLDLTIIFYLRLIMIFIGLCLILVYFRSRFSWVPIAAFMAWFLSPHFGKNYFYLVAVFHALQYLPFYFERTGFSNYKTHVICVVMSLALVFLLPNILNQNTVINGTVFFVLILICLNLHHFLMETVSWKKS